jgi:ribosomal protein S12 methylthiotransferase
MQGDSPRTIYFASLGCPKNRVDTEVMLGVSEASGLCLTSDAAEAEVIVVNTCGFIGAAKKESIETILELSLMKQHGACKKLVVTGCLSQRYGRELEHQMGEVDHFLGSSDMLKLRDVLAGGAERMLVGNPADWVVKASDPRVLTESTVSAYVKIAEGCNRSCAFCTIPEFRGKQRSRPEDDIVREAEQLASQGVVELNLISQDTVSYGRDLGIDKARGATGARDGAALARLVRRVADTKGVRWVRLFYLYPETLDDALVDLLANHPRVVPYVDMPLQHAADAMLKRMRRGHGKERQKRVVERLRNAIPDLSFRTAFIVGHPGETDAEFGELCDFIEWAKFEHVGVFRFSDEESARTFPMPDKVPPLVAANRYRKVMALQRRIARAANARLLGRDLEVLVTGPSEEHEFVLEGRHRGQAPGIDGKVFLSGGLAEAGEIRRVRVEQTSDYDVVGELLDEAGVARMPAKRRVSLKVV